MLAVSAAVLLCLAAGLLLLFLWRSYSYWSSRGVPGPAPSVPFGNCGDSVLGRRTVYEDFAEHYRDHKHRPYIGIYYLHNPLLQLHDLDIIKDVLTREFHDFSGRGTYSNPEQDALSGQLFILSGQAWRNLRVKLSPTFSTGKIRQMFPRFDECGANLRDHVESMAADGGGAYQEDVRELLARYSTDIISSVVFGIESNTMSQPDSVFRLMGKRALEPSFSKGMRFNLLFFARDLVRWFNVNAQSADVNEFFARLVADTIEYREKNNVERADLLNLLMQLKNKGFVASDSGAAGEEAPADGEKTVQKLPLSLVIAQAFLFYMAGFETTSSVASFTLYELAKHPAVLEKLLQEVDRVLEQHDGKVTYEAVTSVPYMDQVISETLRLYPSVQFLTREAMRRRTLPGTNLMLDKGTSIVIPVNAIHRDPDLWRDPDTFDPERFSERNKDIHPMAYIPFGEGPRICIGMRLGLVQVKTALLTVLSRFSVSRSPDTPDTVKLEPYSFITAPVGGLPVLLTRRKK